MSNKIKTIRFESRKYSYAFAYSTSDGIIKGHIEFYKLMDFWPEKPDSINWEVTAPSISINASEEEIEKAKETYNWACARREMHKKDYEKLYDLFQEVINLADDYNIDDMDKRTRKNVIHMYHVFFDGDFTIHEDTLDFLD